MISVNLVALGYALFGCYLLGVLIGWVNAPLLEARYKKFLIGAFVACMLLAILYR